MASEPLNNTDDGIPEPVWSGSFMLGNCEMKCHVMPDGTRIIEEESLANFFMGEVADTEKFHDQLLEFAKWSKSK